MLPPMFPGDTAQLSQNGMDWQTSALIQIKPARKKQLSPVKFCKMVAGDATLDGVKPQIAPDSTGSRNQPVICTRIFPLTADQRVEEA
jgi:hypothetical protein